MKIYVYNKMANFLNSVNPSNFGLNVTGNFNNLASSGTFPLPNTDLRKKLDQIGANSRSSGAAGSVQLSNGSGGFTHDDELFFSSAIGAAATSTGLVIGDTNLLQLEAGTPPGGLGAIGAGSIKYSGANSLELWNGTAWVSLTGQAGSTVAPPLNSIQFNSNNAFGGSNQLTWDGSSFFAADTTLDNELKWDTTTPDFHIGRAITSPGVAPNSVYQLSTQWDTNVLPATLKELRLLGEPDYTPLTASIAVQLGNNVLTGVHLMSQVVSNETKGITSMWPFGQQARNLQIYRFHGHDFKTYSSLDPIEDSILFTGGQNANPGPSFQPPATMDLGMSSRVPFSTSNGSTGSGWADINWTQSGEDDPFIPDPYENTGGYGEWEGQLTYKAGAPGLYIEERRWDRIFGRTNYTGELSLRSTYAPSVNPNGIAVSGIDFYDVELANLINVTEATDLRLGSKMGFGMGRLNVARNTQTIGELMVITTGKTLTLLGNGVNYSSPNQYGAASIYFRNVGPNAQPGGTGPIVADNYTALIDGIKGEFKALGFFQAGSSSPGVTNTMTLSPDNLTATWQGPGLGAPVDVGTFGVGTGGGVGFGQISLSGNNGIESLSMKGINSTSGPAPFKSIDMKTGLAYFDNSFAVNNGVNSDNVGVMSISQSFTSGQNNTNVLQVSSAIDIGDPAAYTGGLGQNVLALRNTTVGVDLLVVDTAGFSSGTAHIPGAVGGVPSTNVAHTLVADMQPAGGAAATYGGSVLSLETDALNGNTGTYFFNDPTTPLNGYSFLQARNTSIVGGKKLILDGDGSVKCSVSLTVSQNTGSLPDNGGVSVNLIPSIGTNTVNGTTGGSSVTATYSLNNTAPFALGASSPLQLQAGGPSSTNATGFAVLNPVRIIPNRTFSTPAFSPTTCFQICDLNTSGNPTNNENLMFWTKNTDISNGESLLMSARPAGSKSGAQTKPIWTFQSGGVITGSIPGYCFRYFPEGNSFDGASSIIGSRLILSDDNPVSTANGGIVRVGAGKSRPKSSFTAGDGGWLESDVIDTRWTFTEAIDYGNTGAGSGCLLIGAGLTDCVQMSVDNGGGGNGYVDLERTGSIISGYATTPAGGLNGPTNICNRQHNGYIGCPGLIPSDGTGIRGYSVLATTFSAAAKLYTAKNQGQQVGEQGYVCCSAVEAPQGVIIMRGRVRLNNIDATIDLDSAQVAPGQLVIPHTNPDAAFPTGTVDAMYQNFTVSVTNAGILSGAAVYPDLDFDPSPGQVSGIIKISPTATPGINQVSLIIRNLSLAPTPDIFVDWVVYSERKDVGYKSAGAVTPGTGFVTSYTNPVSGTYDTWGTPAYGSQVPGAPTNGVDLDNIYGADNYFFE